MVGVDVGVRVGVWVGVEVDESVVAEDVGCGDGFDAVSVPVAVDGRIVRGRRGVALVKRDRSVVCSVVSTAVLGGDSFF